ncbi:hypothetical protein BaRGS_00018643 [Batillaria attramentaria]|uniref:MAM domain-containing protein n=1 Tax=Batillaria attramentaria TaxID=370345 RepID=A0ABD0KS88_9CAEN
MLDKLGCVFVHLAGVFKLALVVFDSNYHATAESDAQNSIARLQSPWLCATGTKTTSFQFGYYMGRDSGVCQLSVMVKSRSGTTVLTTRHSHEGSDYRPVGPLYIVCPHNQYQIIVEAKKLTSESCGYATKGIDIDNIEVRVENGVRQTAYFCPEPSTTTRQSAGTIIPSPLFTTTEGSTSLQSSILTTRKSILTSKGLSSEPFTASMSEAIEEQHFTDVPTSRRGPEQPSKARTNDDVTDHAKPAVLNPAVTAMAAAATPKSDPNGDEAVIDPQPSKRFKKKNAKNTAHFSSSGCDAAEVWYTCT